MVTKREKRRKTLDTACFIPNTIQQNEELESLGLKSEWLQEVGMKALAAYNQTTTNDATTAPGSYAYFAAVRTLLRIELSLPVKMDIDGLRVSKWNKRIIIDPIDFSHTPDQKSLNKEFAQEFPIELAKKI